MITTKARAHISAAFVALGAATLYRFPAERFDIYPSCPIFKYLHVYCPGCGATRALSALLHGNLSAALHYNALFVVLLPFLLAYFALAYFRAVRNENFDWPALPSAALQYALACLLVFAVFRNALQPHL